MQALSWHIHYTLRRRRQQQESAVNEKGKKNRDICLKKIKEFLMFVFINHRYMDNDTIAHIK
jgi:hypothetical protein